MNHALSPAPHPARLPLPLPPLGNFPAPSADLDRPRIALVGLGPYAAATYLPYLKKLGNPPELLIELDTARDAAEKTLRSFDLDAPVLALSRSDFGPAGLTPQAHLLLAERVARAGITHAIVATEPQAHLCYLKFFISRGIHCLTEKPLTAEAGSSIDARKALKLKKDYRELAGAYARAKRGLKVAVQVQRRFHPGYLFVREQIRRLSRRFNVPVTHVDLFNSDGSWSMPDEFLSREKHSYKHGFGELLHSGYHFVDLVNWLRTSAEVSEDKRADRAEIQSAATRPADQLQVLDEAFYREHLQNGSYGEVFAKAARGELKSFGELDVHSLLQFRRGARTVTTAALNLISSGFSRRAWTHLPEDTFKSNGRLSHERVTIHLGPLASILVERYQSGERGEDLTRFGERDHFDVTVFENAALTGGPAMTRHSIKDVTRLLELPYWSSGASDYARFQSLRNFLSSGPSDSGLLDHEDSIELLAALCKSVALHGQGRSSRVRVSLSQGGIA